MSQTLEQRRSLGQARRKQLRRQDHNVWRPQDRSYDPMELLSASMRGRVPSIVALKYERMAASPFGFFRGAVPIMAADLATLPNTGIVSQICGDAHVRNLGAYAAPDGRLVFDINDFDETTRGPFEWDMKRLATSLVLAGREVGEKVSATAEAVHTFVAQYRKSIQNFSRMTVLDVARFQVHRLQRIAPVSQVLLKAERATPLLSLETLTEPAKNRSGSATGRVFKNEEPLMWRLSAAQARPVLGSLNQYRETLLPERRHFLAQYQPIDVAFKVVGTGSVGVRDYVIYFEGNGPDDPLFLQIKEEPGSAYAPYVDTAGVDRHQGQRTAEGQRAMQFVSDTFLGWTTIAHREYLVRQLNDHKGAIEMTDLKGEGLLEYARVCGELLARGHARSGDSCILAGYLGSGSRFDEALAEFAAAYADQTEADWNLLLKSKYVPKKASRRNAKSAEERSADQAGKPVS
jgi:uncharacterized protein (DUF2252 family)